MSEHHPPRISTPSPTSASVTVFASAASWIESAALAQCQQVAALDGMVHVAAMPDLHPGKGAPIGAAMASTVLYPFLVGSDIGCGIAVFPIKLKRAVPERLASRFPDLDRALDPERDADDPAWAVVQGDVPAGHLAGAAPDPAAYLARHDDAVRWGSLNRRVLAARVAYALGAEPTDPIVDQCHNLVEIRDGVYLHRKGAAPGDGRDVLVAGTRGTASYLVAAHAGPEANHSVAHGAGRKMSRADALRRGRAKHTVEELRRTPVGSLVVCGDRQLLFEEAPTAYKRIEQVIADLVEHQLATPVVTTIPLVTYKTPDLGSTARSDRRGHRGRRGGS
ncbi:RtcB family protein [Micromonospora zamorensis]|uniref:RtcB family protein n=1 Tax=Micromonospora zamorensis TaxID=709883 RepID=UPI0033B86DE8